jgi:hypothetical protein
MFSFTVTPGKILAAGEKLTNAKANQGFNPTVTPTGGLEWAQTRLDAYFGGTNGGLVNAYTLQMANVTNNRTAPLPDGLMVLIRPTITNTAASTLVLKDSTGATIQAASAIKKRGTTALGAGDLVAGQAYWLTWDLANVAWQMTSPWGAIGSGADLAPDQYFYGASGGTGTAYTLTCAPPATALKVGMVVRFTVPVDNTNATTTLNVNGLGAKTLRKWYSAVLEPGDLVTGMSVEAIYNVGTDTWDLLMPGLTAKQLVIGTAANAQNLVGSRTNVTTVNVTTDQILVQNASKAVHLLSAVNISPAITGAGAGGLDTGAEAASTWYYIWVIWNSATNSVTGLLSTSSTAPTMPAGYDYKALVSVVRNDAGSNFVDYYQQGRDIGFVKQTIFTAKGAVAGNTYEVLAGADLTAFQAAVPPIARKARGYAGDTIGSTAMVMAVAANNTGFSEVLMNAASGANAIDSFFSSGFWEIILTTQNVSWKSLDTTLRHGMRVSGFSI